MKKFKLNLLIEYLKDNKILFDLFLNEVDESMAYSFASIKNKIKNGIYYLDNIQTLDKFQIQESIIITNSSIETTNCLIVVANPQLVHYKLCSLAANPIEFKIATSSKIHPLAIIAKNVSIGENCVIGTCVIESEVIIKNNVVIEDNVVIKKNTFIDNNSNIGAAGIAWIWDENGKRILQPQLGGLIIEEDCYIGTDVTLVRGSLSENSKVGKGTVISHGTKIGHGVQIEENVHIANNVTIAGNAHIYERSFLGSACVISSNIKIPPNCIVGVGSVVNNSFEEEYITIVGVPAKIIKRKNFETKPNGAPKPYK